MIFSEGNTFKGIYEECLTDFMKKYFFYLPLK